MAHRGDLNGLLRYIDGTRYVIRTDGLAKHGPLRDCACCPPEDHQWVVVFSHLRTVGGRVNVGFCVLCFAHRVQIFDRGKGSSDADYPSDEFFLCRDAVVAAGKSGRV